MEEVLQDRRRQWLLMSVVALALFLDGLDGTIVNVVLPNIAESFGVGTGKISWVVTVYYLMMAGLILIFGKIADSGLIKRLFIMGLLIFAFSSLACGLSTNLGMLLVFRAVQGVGAAMIATTAFMLCVKYLPKGMATFALSVGVLGTSIGAAIGPAVGGVLAEFMSWHLVFFINVPVGIVGALVAMHAIPRDSGFESPGFDIKGAAVLFLVMITGLYAVESVPSHGITPVSGLCVVISLISLAVFVLIEKKAVDPIVKLRLFRLPRLDAVIIALIIINVVYLGAVYLLPFYLQVVMGLDTIGSGLYLFIPSIGILSFCLWVGKAADRIGNRPFVIASAAAMIVTMALFYIMDADTIGYLVAGLFILGVTWGLAGGPIGGRMLDNVPEDDRPKASALLSFFIYFGCALGTASFAGLFGLGSGSSGTEMQLLSPDVFLEGFRFAMMVGLIMSVVMLILSWIVNEKKVAKPDE